jgi:multiple sugar transport system substrate-binding protein
MITWCSRIVLSLSLLTCAAAARAAAPSTAGASSGSDVELTVASYPSFDESVKAALPRWRALHPNIQVKLRSLSYGDHHATTLSALQGDGDVPDVVGVAIEHLGQFARSRGLEDLGEPPYEGRPLLARFLAFTRPQATPGAGALIAVPADVGPGTLFYRSDLLERAGVSEEELTRSWDTFIEAGRKVKAATGAFLVPSARIIKDVFIRAGLKDGEGVFLDAAGRPVIDSPRFERAFALAKRAHDAGIEAGLHDWSNEWVEALRTGRLAAQPMGHWLAGHLATWLAPATSGLWRAVQLPEGAYASWGGNFYAIPRRAAHKKEAWELIQFLCLDREQQALAMRTLDAWPALLEAQDLPSMAQPIPFLGGQAARRLWRTAAANVPAIRSFELDGFAAATVDAALDRVLAGSADVKAALAEAQQAVLRRAQR